MARFENNPPIFYAPRAEQATEYPRDFALPEQVAPIVPGAPATEPPPMAAEPTDPGHPDSMPNAVMDGAQAQAADHAEPRAEIVADYHAELELPGGPQTVENAGENNAAPESLLRADNADAEHPGPESVAAEPPDPGFPEVAAIDDPQELRAEHVAENPQDDSHGNSDEMPDQAMNSQDNSSHAQVSAQAEQASDGQASRGQSDFGRDNQDGDDSGSHGRDFTPATGDDFFGLPIFLVDEIPPQFQDDPEEEEEFDFFL